MTGTARDVLAATVELAEEELAQLRERFRHDLVRSAHLEVLIEKGRRALAHSQPPAAKPRQARLRLVKSDKRSLN